MQVGYTDDDINTVFGRIEEATRVTVVVVWDYYDFTTGGNSDFYVLAAGRLHHCAADLGSWLMGDPADPETPAHPGDPATWTGPDTGVDLADLAYSDHRHNYARRRA